MRNESPTPTARPLATTVQTRKAGLRSETSTAATLVSPRTVGPSTSTGGECPGPRRPDCFSLVVDKDLVSRGGRLVRPVLGLLPPLACPGSSPLGVYLAPPWYLRKLLWCRLGFRAGKSSEGSSLLPESQGDGVATTTLAGSCSRPLWSCLRVPAALLSDCSRCCLVPAVYAAWPLLPGLYCSASSSTPPEPSGAFRSLGVGFPVAAFPGSGFYGRTGWPVGRTVASPWCLPCAPHCLRKALSGSLGSWAGETGDCSSLSPESQGRRGVDEDLGWALPSFLAGPCRHSVLGAPDT